MLKVKLYFVLMLFSLSLFFFKDIFAEEAVIYGKLTESMSLFNTGRANGNAYNELQLSSNSSRIGFKGKEILSTDLQAFWKIECGIAMTGEGKDLKQCSRNKYVGFVSNNLGTLRLGHIDTAFKKSSKDIFSGTVADYNRIIGAASGTKASKLFDKRKKNYIEYYTPSFMYTQFVFGHAPKGSNNTELNSFALKYRQNKKGYLNYAYEWQHDEKLSHKKVSAHKIGGGLSFEHFYASFVYLSINDEAKKSTLTHDAWMLGGQYKIDNNAFKLMFMNADHSKASRKDGADSWSLGIYHSLSKQTTLIALYSSIDNDKQGLYGFNAATSDPVVPGENNITPGVKFNVISLAVRHVF